MESIRQPACSPWWRLGLWGAVLLTLALLIGAGVLAAVCAAIGFGVGLVAQPKVPEKKIDDRVAVQGLTALGEIVALDFSPDGKYIVAGTKYTTVQAGLPQGEIVAYDASTGEKKIHQQYSQWVPAFAIHPSGKWIAVANASDFNGRNQPELLFEKYGKLPGEVSICEFPSMKEFKFLTFERTVVGSVRFSPDGKTLAVVRQKGIFTTGTSEVVLYDFPSMDERILLKDVRLAAHGAGLPLIAFSHDSKEILVMQHVKLGMRDCVMAYDTKTGKEERRAADYAPKASMEVTKDGLLVISGSGLFVVDCVANREPPEFNKILRNRGDFPAETISGSLSPDKKRMLATTRHRDGREIRHTTSEVVIEDFEKKEVTTAFQEKGVEFTRCCWSPTGKQFAVGTSFYRGLGARQDELSKGRSQVLLFDFKAP